MSVIYTNGQSWEDIAREFTLSPEYAPGIAEHHNMTGQSITGKKYYLNIPDSWMKPEYAGKEIKLPSASSSNIAMWVAAGAALLFMLTTK